MATLSKADTELAPIRAQDGQWRERPCAALILEPLQQVCKGHTCVNLDARTYQNVGNASRGDAGKEARVSELRVASCFGHDCAKTTHNWQLATNKKTA